MSTFGALINALHSAPYISTSTNLPTCFINMVHWLKTSKWNNLLGVLRLNQPILSGKNISPIL